MQRTNDLAQGHLRNKDPIDPPEHAATSEWLVATGQAGEHGAREQLLLDELNQYRALLASMELSSEDLKAQRDVADDSKRVQATVWHSASGHVTCTQVISTRCSRASQ